MDDYRIIYLLQEVNKSLIDIIKLLRFLIGEKVKEIKDGKER